MKKIIGPIGNNQSSFRHSCLWLIFLVLLGSCSSSPNLEPVADKGKIVCDSYIVLDMCVRDLIGDGTVDMIYFTDTREIFMYREGMKETVAKVMSFHQCAVVLSAGMQATTDSILNRENLTLTQELSITKDLISNYFAAKSEIDACNATFDAEKGLVSEPAEDFYIEEWED